ncbi:MAG: outer membrane beta-barrel protein [Acidobacteria bacterium]|nr:outer membrane beta-barrel protein [Acidobacteriota bacterium]
MRLGLVLALGCVCARAQNGRIEPTDAPSSSASAASAETPQPANALWRRLGRFYRTDWNAAPSTGAPPARRALDAPLDSPPFPSSDWSYGGAPTIGVPDGNVYPLMAALKKENSRTKLYGWVNVSMNGSTSGETNYPITYGFVPNRLVLNQAMLTLERLPDTVQRKHFDWGFHLSGIFGTDYRYTTAKGYFSSQLLEHNRQYGFDPLWQSLDLYFPVKEGLVIRIGRFLAVPGIETQIAPGNLTMTHSLVFSATPSTATGAIASLKLTKQWMVQLGISAGNDAAPWSEDRKPSAIACVNYSTASNHDNLYLCANGINDGRYAYNNVQQYDALWNHRFNAKWNTATEAWFMYERDVPNVAHNVLAPLPPETGANGAFCAAGQRMCTAPEYAAMSYLNYAVNSKLYIGLRSGLVNDKKGQRTGTPGKSTANALYLTKTIGSTVSLRSELRYDRSWDRPAYNNGKTKNQLFFGVDLIYRF